MKIIALDQSTSACGYAVMDKGNLIISGVYKPKYNLKGDDRPYAVAKYLSQLIDEHEPDLVMLEGVWLQVPSAKKTKGEGENVNTHLVLSTLLGMLKYVVMSKGVTCETVQPMIWKAFYGFTKLIPIGEDRRKIGKQRAIAKAELIKGDVVTEDEAEAICICQYAWDNNR